MFHHHAVVLVNYVVHGKKNHQNDGHDQDLDPDHLHHQHMINNDILVEMNLIDQNMIINLKQLMKKSNVFDVNYILIHRQNKKNQQKQLIIIIHHQQHHLLLNNIFHINNIMIHQNHVHDHVHVRVRVLVVHHHYHVNHGVPQIKMIIHGVMHIYLPIVKQH